MYSTTHFKYTNTLSTNMVNKYRRRRRDRRSNPRINRNLSILRNVSSGLKGLQSTRSLTFAPKTINKSNGSVTPSWLETAFPYLVIAMKFVGALLSTPTSLYSSVNISSTIQSILISAEDIMYDHPITSPSLVQVDGKSVEIMHCDYSMVRLTGIKIVISLMGSVNLRAGRLAACLIPLNFEKAIELNEEVSRSSEVVDFKQLTQKPGSIVSPNLRPLTIVQSTSGFTARRAMLGSPHDRDDRGGKLVYPRGGLPLFELIVGYQDLAAASADPKLAYSLEEATLCVEISGSLVLDAPVSRPRALRSIVRTVFSSNNVSVYSPGSRQPAEIPIESLRYNDGVFEILPEVDQMSDDFEKI